ncbi:MAG: M42 family peptidase, partial [Verrucomicrobia bacterium]|nr:M42 family peptidase [Verrucomicrobiota bacterium]
MSTRLPEVLRLLEDYTQAHGTSGHEDAVRAIFVRELRGRAFSADGLGGVLAAPASPKGGPRVVLTAHMDEIGFLVQAVTHDGFLRVVPVGGWPDGVLAAQRLRVWSRAARKEFLGVVAALPPHQGGAQAASADKVLVDIGARSAEAVARLGIRPGDPVVPEGPFTALAEPGLYVAKAFDNRVGMAALTLATHALDAAPPACDLLAVATVQEEVGCRGAVVAARLAKPDVVIVLEGPPADDLPGLAPHGETQGALGGGVQVRAYDPTAIMNPRLVDLALQVAAGQGIPCQLAVRRTGGTDARAFQAHELGLPVIVLGVPAR